MAALAQARPSEQALRDCASAEQLEHHARAQAADPRVSDASFYKGDSNIRLERAEVCVDEFWENLHTIPPGGAVERRSGGGVVTGGG